MNRVILVDLDNLYFRDEKPCKELLMNRIEIIKKISPNLIYFGNIVTEQFLKSKDIKLPKIYVSKLTNDNADHMIVHKLKYYLNRYKTVYVVTNDKNLIKFVDFVHKRPIIFNSFDELDLVDVDVNNFCFRDKDQLQKFIVTYNLYKIRYYT